MDPGMCDFEFGLGTRLTLCCANLGRRLAMLLSLLFLHRFNYLIPHNPNRALPRVGMPLSMRALSSTD
jgi:hypothetical protein